MKLITFAVPSYNSEAYMRKCIDSLLAGGEDVEIVIVNDGSKDATGSIADEYAAAHPDICRAVHQENGGHGEGVNQGIRHATGLYYKVVDSDDRVDADALRAVLDTIKAHLAANDLPDLYITDFVYDHAEDGTTFTRSYKKNMPTGRMFGWKDVKRFRGSSTLLMHSLMYRTEVLRECGLELPKHTFSSTTSLLMSRCLTSRRCTTCPCRCTGISSAGTTSPSTWRYSPSARSSRTASCA